MKRSVTQQFHPQKIQSMLGFDAPTQPTGDRTSVGWVKRSATQQFHPQKIQSMLGFDAPTQPTGDRTRFFV